MSTKAYTRYQQLWLRAVHLTICETLNARLISLEDTYDTINEAKHLKWRLGYNYYNGFEYFKAIHILEELCGDEINEENNVEQESTALKVVNDKPLKSNNNDINNLDSSNLHENSFVHQITARCCLRLFLQTESHYHLENAYKHYQHAIDTLQADLFAMFRLPALLLEFGKVLEYYGAFEAVVEIYTKILTQFPNFRGYFDALYRSAMVGLHTSELSASSEEKAETINKCMDMFQFLLEEIPSSVVDVSTVHLFNCLTYANALQMKVESIALLLMNLLSSTSFFSMRAHWKLPRRCKSGFAQ